MPPAACQTSVLSSCISLQICVVSLALPPQTSFWSSSFLLSCFNAFGQPYGEQCERTAALLSTPCPANAACYRALPITRENGCVFVHSPLALPSHSQHRACIWLCCSLNMPLAPRKYYNLVQTNFPGCSKSNPASPWELVCYSQL